MVVRADLSEEAGVAHLFEQVGCRSFVRARRRVGGRGKTVNVSSIHEEVVEDDDVRQR